MEKYLPEKFKSWFEFYQDVKRQILPEGTEEVVWEEYRSGSIVSSRAQVATKKYRYSLRYIEQQTLAELIELRTLNTFSEDELVKIYQSLRYLSPMDTSVKPVEEKVGKLLFSKRRTRRS